MDFHALSCFVEIAKELSFSKAARHLNITQPPLTRKIQRLESEWGVKLFIRDHRGVQLTDAGRLLLRGVDSVFAAADRLKAIASLAAEGKAGWVLKKDKVRLAVGDSSADTKLAKVIYVR